MKATETNLNRFLAQPDTQFVIPVYQRNYDWKQSHCKQLVDDILAAGDNSKIKSHFIGSIVFIHDSLYSSAGINELTIIDGQQRITTITLIYIVLYQLAKKSGNKKTESKIQKTYLINEFAEEEKLKLRPTENNDKALKFLLKSDANQYFEDFSRLVENFEYIKTRINEENIDVLVKGLDKLMFVEISLERDKDNPQRIFESLNSTGLELSQADLIRNYILMGLKPKQQLIIYEDYWQHIERLCTVQESNENRVSDFIRDFLTIEKRDIPTKSKVFQAFKDNYKTIEYESLSGHLNKIKRFATFYNKLINSSNESDPAISRQIYLINKLEINVSYPFLLEVYSDYEGKKIDKDTLVAVFELVQTFVWRRFIVGLPTNALNKIFMRLYEDVDKSDYLASIQRSLLKRRGSLRFPIDSEIRDALRDKDIYSLQSRNRMYFLERLENFENKEPVSITGNPDITIEHIFPQKPDIKWLEYLGKEEFETIKEKHLNTIANLTLSGNNGSLGNKPFKEKRDLPGKGYRDSRLFLNKYLAGLEKWGIDEINERYRILCDRFIEIWKYPDVEVDLQSNSEEINIFDSDDPTNKKLEYIIFREEKHQFSKVAELYIYVLSYLFTEQPITFFTTDLGEKIQLTKDKSVLRYATSLNETYFIEGNLSNRDKFEKLKYALAKFEITDDLIIKFAD